MRQFTVEEIRQYYENLKAKTEKSGYRLNPDEEYTLGIVESLLTNEERYGYQLCPCRLTSGSRQADLDIICPCDYRDLDLAEYGRCYCALYVSKDVTLEQLSGSIPERRNKKQQQESEKPQQEAQNAEGGIPVWRCRVCGYLCARPNPPEVCPICGASKDRFERFSLK
ncbi:MAG TPA: ferredoxin-thioredoxin reductase catalytic domain-containing protein [Fervidobacterium sp.]|nr:ferredoxin-thioredoxin reductase catalytic domain-containing protein [Fervidobacterium sp.]